jgi:hypothetical protein
MMDADLDQLGHMNIDSNENLQMESESDDDVDEAELNDCRA